MICTLENDYLRLRVSQDGAELVSIYNKEKNCEFSEAIWLINKFITLNYVGEYWFICEELLNFVKVN